MDNIGDIINSLSDEDINMLQNAAKELFGSDAAMPFGGGAQSERKNESAGMPDISSMLNADVMAKVGKIMGAMNKKDSRCELINALKPLLSEPRRHKADDVMQMIRLFDILPMLQNLK